jgi:hypothetical protein
MGKLWSSLLFVAVTAVALAGCSKSSNSKSTNSAQTGEARKQTWERVGSGSVLAFKVQGNDPVSTGQGPITPVLYVGCGRLTMLMIRLPGTLPKSAAFDSKVGLVLDGANAQREDWQEVTNEEGDTFAPPNAAAKLHLVVQMLEAKSLKVEMTPKGGALQSTTFNVQGFKDMFGSEPACKSWRDPSNYQ